jgi:hypothetical protein
MARGPQAKGRREHRLANMPGRHIVKAVTENRALTNNIYHHTRRPADGDNYLAKIRILLIEFAFMLDDTLV